MEDKVTNLVTYKNTLSRKNVISLDHGFLKCNISDGMLFVKSWFL